MEDKSPVTGSSAPSLRVSLTPPAPLITLEPLPVLGPPGAPPLLAG